MAGTLAKIPPSCPRYAAPQPFMHIKSKKDDRSARPRVNACWS
jgi:hypothetical protein